MFRDFPVHGEAAYFAAEAADCAGEQGKYWEFHRLLYENQKEWLEFKNNTLTANQTVIYNYAEQLGLNVDEFKTCVESGKYREEVEKDHQDGINYGVTGTPTFFIGTPNDTLIDTLYINGKKFEGYRNYQVFAQLIENYLITTIPVTTTTIKLLGNDRDGENLSIVFAMLLLIAGIISVVWLVRFKAFPSKKDNSKPKPTTSLPTAKENRELAKIIPHSKKDDQKPESTTPTPEDIAQKESPMLTFPPKLLSKYDPLEFLGEGGFAKVFKVKRKDDGRIVALKIPRIDEKTSSLFLKEIAAWYHLNHPNIVKLYKADILPLPYLEMEFVEGINVNGKIVRDLDMYPKPVGERTALDIIKGIASGLAHAHSKEIWHLDLKPLNILLKSDLTPKITDWGLSKISREAHCLPIQDIHPFMQLQNRLMRKLTELLITELTFTDWA